MRPHIPFFGSSGFRVGTHGASVGQGLTFVGETGAGKAGGVGGFAASPRTPGSPQEGLGRAFLTALPGGRRSGLGRGKDRVPDLRRRRTGLEKLDRM